MYEVLDDAEEGDREKMQSRLATGISPTFVVTFSRERDENSLRLCPDVQLLRAGMLEHVAEREIRACQLLTNSDERAFRRPRSIWAYESPRMARSLGSTGGDAVQG